MNEGKDVFTLMREIKLPAELELGESYGKVAWSVRGIYEGYVGWFDLNPATMYAASPNVADEDLVELAGGADGRGRQGQRRSRAPGDPVRGLRLAEAALAAEATNRDALEAKLLALRNLASANAKRTGARLAGLRYSRRAEVCSAVEAAKPPTK